MATSFPETQFEEPKHVASGAVWGVILNVGGMVLLLATVGYSAMTLRNYEEGIRELRAELAAVRPAPPPIPPEPAAAPAALQPVQTVAPTVSDKQPPAPTLAALPQQQRVPAAAPDRTKELADANASLAAVNTENSRLQNELQGLNNTLQAERVAASAGAQSAQGAANALTQAQQRIAMLNNAVIDANASFAGARSEIGRLQSELQQAERDKALAGSQNAAASANAVAAAQQIERLDNALTHANEKMAQCSAELERLRTDYRELTKRTSLPKAATIASHAVQDHPKP